MKIFIAAPFTNEIDVNTGKVSDEYRSKLETLIKPLRNKGFDVFLALEREGWGEGVMPPHICTVLDFKEMQEADLVIAILGNPLSHGVHVELGWASAMSKSCIILHCDGTTTTPLVYGLEHLGLKVIHENIDIFMQGAELYLEQIMSK